MKNKTYNRKKAMVVFFCAVLLISALFGRLVYLMIFDAAHYQKLAKDLHEREERAQWERLRMLAQCVLMPHSKKPLKETDVFKFPWDRLEEVAKKATKADFERMTEMFG